MNIEDLYPIFADEFATAHEEAMRLAVVGALMEMCDKTSCWNEIQDPVALVDGVSEYDVDAPLGAQVTNVLSVHLANGQEIFPKSVSALNDCLPGWRTATASVPTYYNSPTDFGSIIVYPIPTDVAGDELVIRAAYQPLLTATTVSNSIGRRYQDAIAAGARARLFAKTGQPWSDTKWSDYWDKKFKAACTEIAWATKHSDRVSGSIVVRPRAFGQG